MSLTWGPLHFFGVIIVCCIVYFVLPYDMSDMKFVYGNFFNRAGCVIVSNPPVYKYLTNEEQTIEQYVNLDARTNENLSDLDVVRLVPRRREGEYLFNYLVKSKVQYTGTGEAFALKNIESLFRKVNPWPWTSNKLRVEHSLHFCKANNEEDIIILGGWISNAFGSDRYCDPKVIAAYKRALPFSVHDGSIYEKDHLAYSPTYTYVSSIDRSRGDALSLEKEYAIITKIRNIHNGQSILILAGVNSQGTQVAGMITTSRPDALNLRAALSRITRKGEGVPKWFQAVIEIAVDPKNGLPSTKWKVVDAREILESALFLDDSKQSGDVHKIIKSPNQALE